MNDSKTTDELYSFWNEYGYHVYYKPTKERVYKIKVDMTYLHSPLVRTPISDKLIPRLVVSTWERTYMVDPNESDKYLARFPIGSEAEEVLYAKKPSF